MIFKETSPVKNAEFGFGFLDSLGLIELEQIGDVGPTPRAICVTDVVAVNGDIIADERQFQRGPAATGHLAVGGGFNVP